MIPAERFVANKAEDFDGWLNARRYGVTATQVANAATPAGFERAAAEFLVEWREPDNPYMQFGREWESHIADYVDEAYQVRPNEWLIRGENPAHLCTPDGLSDNHTIIGEYKTTGKDWGHVEKLPIRYRRQIQWQLHVTGAQSCIVAWLVREEVDTPGGPLFVPKSVTPHAGIMFRDEDMIADLVETADRLWSFVNGG